MQDNNIRSRHHLAQVLPVGRATVYASFNEDWSGNATETMMAELSALLSLNFGTLVRSDVIERKTRRSVKKAS
jgi:hypothetical protein